MAANYFLRFGFGNPANYTGLSPTFLTFKDAAGNNFAGVSLTEVPSSTGIYTFLYGGTLPVSFVADAATTSPGVQGRYVTGSVEPVTVTDPNTVGLGATLIALGATLAEVDLDVVTFGNAIIAQTNTLLVQGSTILAAVLNISGFSGSAIGSTASSYGTDTQDPTDLFGYMKRIQELLEGNAAFSRQNQVWNLLSRGSTTLLRSKIIGTDTVGVTKV